MSVLDRAVVATALVAAVRWRGARRRWPGALDMLSSAALGLAVATLAVEGLRWQLVPWQLLALAVAASAGLRRRRPGRSRRWRRVLGQLGPIAGWLPSACRRTAS